MPAAVLAATLGLLAPFVLCRLSGRGPTPALWVVAHTTSLLLAWAGLLGVVGQLAAPQSGLLDLCGVLLSSLWSSSSPTSRLLAVLIFALLPGRALWTATTASFSAGKTGRGLRKRGVGSGAYTSVGGLGTIAVTVGFPWPVIAVDPEHLDALEGDAQHAILDHERAHLRGAHHLVDLLVRALAAGLSPWPGARTAHREVRRHLEAVADDAAARRGSRRTVARAIVDAASTVPVVGLGSGGWSHWRVDRLLTPPAAPLRLIAGVLLVTVPAGLIGAQGTTHALAGIHLWRVTTLLCGA